MSFGEISRRFGRGQIDQDKVASSAFLAAILGSPLVALCAFAYSFLASLLGGRIPDLGFNDIWFIPLGLLGLGFFGVIVCALAYIAAFPIVLLLQVCGWLSGYALVATGVGLVALPGALTHNFSFFFSMCGGATAAIFWWNAGIANQTTPTQPAGPMIPLDNGTN